MSVLLEAKNISKSFQKDKQELSVLKDVSLELKLGEELVLWGASGSGKTTLLHLLGGLENPSEGLVLFEGNNLAFLSDAERAEFRNKNYAKAKELFIECERNCPEDSILFIYINRCKERLAGFFLHPTQINIDFKKLKFFYYDIRDFEKSVLT